MTSLYAACVTAYRGRTGNLWCIHRPLILYVWSQNKQSTVYPIRRDTSQHCTEHPCFRRTCLPASEYYLTTHLVSISRMKESNFFRPSSSNVPPTPQMRQNRNHISNDTWKCSPVSSLDTPFSGMARASNRRVKERTQLRRSQGTNSLRVCDDGVRETSHTTAVRRVCLKLGLHTVCFFVWTEQWQNERGKAPRMGIWGECDQEQKHAYETLSPRPIARVVDGCLKSVEDEFSKHKKTTLAMQVPSSTSMYLSMWLWYKPT